MKKVCIQIGHLNVKTNCVVSLRGSTGTSGEVEVNKAIGDALVSLLQAAGLDTKKVDANFNCDPTSLDTDYDLFLALHCDMNYANDQGSGFCDFPEPSTDGNTKESQRMTKVIQDTFFPAVGINVKSRSNVNTRKYYMWESISEKTPCVLIEMGQVKDPHDALILKDTAKVAKALRDSILTALGTTIPDECEKQLVEMRASRDKWKSKYEELDKSSTKEVQEKIKHIEELQKTMAEQNNQLNACSSSAKTNSDSLESLRKELEASKQAIITVNENLIEANKENVRLVAKLQSLQVVEKERLLDRIIKFLRGGE